MDPETFAWQFRTKLKTLPSVCLLGIRGFLEPENKMDIYDDVIVRWIDGELTPFRASVDPGSYYLLHPLNPQGCARLQCGFWEYARGEHLHSHQALIQADEVTVDRLGKDGRFNGSDTGWFGINIHSGGNEYLVGRWSAGCQVIYTEEPWDAQWLEFFEPICGALAKSKQTRIPYLLIDDVETTSNSNVG